MNFSKLMGMVCVVGLLNQGMVFAACNEKLVPARDGNVIDVLAGTMNEKPVGYTTPEEAKGTEMFGVSKWIIPPKFEDGRQFCDGLAAVKRDGKWGYIDEKGTVIVPFSYADAKNFSEKLAEVKPNKLWTFLDRTTLKDIMSEQFEETKPFIDGHASVKVNSKWGAIDKTGKMVLAAILDVIPHRYLDYWLTEKDGKWGAVDLEGKTILDNEFTQIKRTHSPVVGVQQADQWALADLSEGKVKTKFMFTELGEFSGKLVNVKYKQWWGYVNDHYGWEMQPTYRLACPFLPATETQPERAVVRNVISVKAETGQVHHCEVDTYLIDRTGKKLRTLDRRFYRFMTSGPVGCGDEEFYYAKDGLKYPFDSARCQDSYR